MSKSKEHKEHSESKESKESKHAQLNAALIWTLAAAGVFLVLGAGVVLAAVGYDRLYTNRIFPGVRALGVRLDGLTADEARSTLHGAIDNALKDGVRFTYGKREITLGSAAIAQSDPDLSRDYVSYEIDGTISAAMSFGRSGNPLTDAAARFLARARPVGLTVETAIDQDGIRSAILKNLANDLPQIHDARLIVSFDANSPTAKVEEGVTGKTIVFDPAFVELARQSESLRFSPIVLTDQSVSPKHAARELEPLRAEAERLAEHAPITLSYGGKTYDISKERFASWISVVEHNGKLAASIDPAIFAEDIRKLAPIETQAKKGTFIIENGVLKNFEAGTSGIAIDDGATRQSILDNIGSTTTFPIIAKTVEAALDGTDSDRLGIKEIIGIGTSDFSGSPTNRRKNIANGVSKVNGTIIEAGKEFSLLKTLGAITPENGWLPELVIKGNETTPELGGGLCQIGTTAFRAALNSGLKITERRNHSYRVVYYEPAGTDATIYDPAPDFKFVNDTAHAILIHAYITGNTVTYEFWGTKDGRKATVGPSKISNIVAPPPKKMVETLSLKPGQTKCTESAHAGADAELPYHVQYADATTHDETFFSHYRPWQAVCLVGVEKLSDTAPTSTDATP